MNTFSITQGHPKDGGSCVAATEACLKVCYDATLRRIYKGYRAVEDDNYALVKDASYEEQLAVIKNTINKWLLTTGHEDARFRIHTGGEFFNESYTKAWRQAISDTPEVNFWVYTRAIFAVDILAGLHNLTLLLSCDPDNKDDVLDTYDKFKHHANIAVAWMGNSLPENFPEDRQVLICPEVSGKTKNTEKQGACARCRACINRPLKSGKTRHIQFPIHK
jgi:ferredoxin